MADVSTMKSYLVALGFKPNMEEYKNFSSVMTQAASLVTKTTTKMATDILKWETAIIGMFVAVGAAVVTNADKVAMADQNYRFLGERMFMSTEHARAMDVALKTLGVTMNEVFFDKETHDRFIELINLQETLTKQLGPNYEDTMKQIRDIRQEFNKFQVEAQFFLMNVAAKIFEKLGFGSGEFAKKLAKLNDYIVANIPKWSDEFATYIVPVLKDIGMIMLDLWQLAKDVAEVFDDIVSIFSGDSSVSGVVTMEKFAKAIGYAAHWAAVLVHYLLKIAGTITGLLAGAAVGGTLGGLAGAIIGGVLGIPAGPMGVLAGIMTGAGLGSVLGGAAGGVAGGGVGAAFDVWRATKSDAADPSAVAALTGSTGSSGGGWLDSILSYGAAAKSTSSNAASGGLDALAHGIAAAEGFGVKGAIPTTHNNPGDIRSGPRGAIGTYSSAADGYAALIRQLKFDASGKSKIYSPNMTLEEFGKHYTSTDQAAWLANVMKATGFKKTDKIGDIANGSISVTVNVAGTNANPHEIADAAVQKFREERNRMNQKNLVELSSVYG